MMKISLNEVDTVFLSDDENAVVIIDQTLLPGDIVLLNLDSPQEMYDAIARLQVRGAPAIGVFAALSMYVLARVNKNLPFDEFKTKMNELADYLNSSRPTAVNLSWAINQMKSLINTENVDNVDNLVDKLKKKATKIYQDDIEVCKKIGEFGETLIPEGAGVLTHCNAGKLATVRYGTATAPMYLAHEHGKTIHVYCDETRPLLQGARLTAFELTDAGIDTILQCDNMASYAMKQGLIDIIFVGCDRVAANGDFANKIGTSGVAILAKHYGVPFYVCAPSSTIDMSTPTGEDIVIEQRDSGEVTDMWYTSKMSHPDVKVLNPAFDVTDHTLVTGIITEKGIFKPEELVDVFGC